MRSEARGPSIGFPLEAAPGPHTSRP